MPTKPGSVDVHEVGEDADVFLSSILDAESIVRVKGLMMWVLVAVIIVPFSTGECEATIEAKRRRSIKLMVLKLKEYILLICSRLFVM